MTGFFTVIDKEEGDDRSDGQCGSYSSLPRLQIPPGLLRHDFSTAATDSASLN